MNEKEINYYIEYGLDQLLETVMESHVYEYNNSACDSFSEDEDV